MKKIYSIQVLRVICSIFIIINHIDYYNVHKIGAIGVDIFLVISGFVAMLSPEKKMMMYLKKRLKKLVPLYYFLTIIIIIVYTISGSMFTSTINYKNIISSFLFLPMKDTLPILYVGWTLNYILIFYIIFSFSLKVSYRFRGIICIVILLIVVILIDNISILNLMFGFDSMILIEFIYGILLYYIYIYFRIYGKKSNLIMLMVVILLFPIIINYVEISNIIGLNGNIRSFYLGIPATIYCFLFLFSIKSDEKSKINRFILNCADLTYYIYLIHPIIVRGIIKVLPNKVSSVLSINLLILTIILIVICFIISFVLSKIFMISNVNKRFDRNLK